MRRAFFWLPVVLSGCGASFLAHHEYVAFTPMEEAVVQADSTKPATLVYRKVFTNNPQHYKEEELEYFKNNLAIRFMEKEGGWVGVFPLVPPPPFIPVFLEQMSATCPVKNDTLMTVSYVTAGGEDKKIGDYVTLEDIEKVYLIRDNGEVIKPRHILGSDYSYYFCFSQNTDTLNGAVLVVDGLYDKQRQKIVFEPKRLHYYNEYIFGIGYWGSSFNRDAR